MTIKTDHLRVFVTVAQCGSLRDAASSLGRTQSALSMTLKQLEEALGGSLFETERKHSLSDLGQYVFDVASDLLRNHDRSIEMIERYSAGKAGRLRIASVPSVAALVLPQLLQSFMRIAPDADIDLIDTDSAAVRTALTSGTADMGLASLPETIDGIESEFLFRDPLKVVCRAESMLAQADGPLGWNDLRVEPLIMNETLLRLGNPELRELCSSSHLKVRNIVSLLAMVRSGAGFTILPGLATVELPEGLVRRALSDPDGNRSVFMLMRPDRSRSPLATKMAAHLRGQMPAIAARYGLSTQH